MSCMRQAVPTVTVGPREVTEIPSFYVVHVVLVVQGLKGQGL